MFLRSFKIDTSRAKDAWPRQVESLDQLPAPYRTIVNAELVRGLPIQNILYVPQTNKWVHEKQEYVLAWHENRVMTFKKGQCDIEKTEWTVESVLYVQYIHRLLDNWFVVCYQDAGEVKKAALHFNAAREFLFHPMLATLLQNDFNAYRPAMEENLPQIRDSLSRRTFKMCSYLDLMYRFSDRIHAYYWDKMITKEQQKRNAESLKRPEETEYLVSLMDQGMVAQQIAENDIEVLYIRQNAVRQVSVADGENGWYMIQIDCASNEPFYIPVQPQNQALAQEFVRLCDRGISQSGATPDKRVTLEKRA